MSCKVLYKSKVEHLKNCSPATCWKEVKKLSSMSSQVSGREDPMFHLHNIECGPGSTRTTAEDLANIINQTFLEPMKAFDPLPSSPNNQSIERNWQTFCVYEFSVFKKLASLNPTKGSGPDGIPSWILKENSNISAFPVSEILNCSYQGACLPQSWKHRRHYPDSQTKTSPINKIYVQYL